MPMPTGPLTDEEKGQLRQIDNRQDMLETDVQDVARMLLKVVEWIEREQMEEWQRNMGDDL